MTICSAFLGETLDTQKSVMRERLAYFESCLKDAESKPAGSGHEVSSLTDEIKAILDEVKGSKRDQWTCIKEAGSRDQKDLDQITEELEYKLHKCDAFKSVTERRYRREMFSTGEIPKFVGRNKKLKELKTEIDSEDRECKVISVVGERGIGKTTLVNQIYHEVQRAFEFHTAVYVSDEPSVRDVLVEIATKARLSEEDKMDENLKIKLQSLLAEKKYLIYLDDIRSEKTWEDLKRVLLPISSRKGSRIIITSREGCVGGDSIIKLDPLGEKNSRELFSHLTLPEDASRELFSHLTLTEDTKKIRLEQIGWKIVAKCGGVPSAIVFVASMLCGEKWKNEHAWEEVLRNMDKKDILSLINMEEKHLSMDLTACFLYIGVHPEDTDVSVSELARLLLAEELIKVEGAQDAEVLVEAKLRELSESRLIQVSKRTWDGRIKSCRLNHFQRSVCIHHAMKTNFFSTLDFIGYGHYTSIYRLLVDNWILFRSYGLIRYYNLRTWLCFCKDKKYGDKMNAIPNDISRLGNLICLKLTGHYNQMPSSVCNLKKLQIFDVEEATFDTELFPATKNIWRMESIKHLLLSRHHFGDTKAVRKNRSVRNEMNLKNVETLGWIRGDILKTISLDNLRQLKLFDATAKQIEQLSFELENLQQLWLNVDSERFTKLKMSKYEKLDMLHLTSHSEYDIKDIEFPPNLTKLILNGIKFKADPMIELKKIPKLEFLKFKHCFYLLILDCRGPNSFPELQVLEIANSFSKLIVDNEGMPKLRKFVYRGDEKNNIPERLRAITTNIKSSDKTGLENYDFIDITQNGGSTISETEASKAKHIEISSSQFEGAVKGEATSQGPYSTIVCMNILNKMKGVSDQAFRKAINEFKDLNFRIAFVMTPEIRRGNILKLL